MFFIKMFLFFKFRKHDFFLALTAAQRQTVTGEFKRHNRITHIGYYYRINLIDTDDDRDTCSYASLDKLLLQRIRHQTAVSAKPPDDLKTIV